LISPTLLPAMMQMGDHPLSAISYLYYLTPAIACAALYQKPPIFSKALRISIKIIPLSISHVINV